MTSVLEKFTPATHQWFAGAFAAPTSAQEGAWNAISAGSNALVIAPTGSGKTLAAFLWALDKFIASGAAEAEPAAQEKPAAKGVPAKKRGTRVLYISPLKALGVDVERNLRAPMIGITQTAKRLGLPAPVITVGVRSGDTSQADRRALLTRPPDILITTPESLFLMLTSKARETLTDVDTVIIDEVHAVAGSKRGAHLAVSLARLDALLDKPVQRIGLSATVEPQETVARFLGGNAPVEIVAPPSKKQWDLTVTVPVEDMTELGGSPTQNTGDDDAYGADAVPQGSIWPHVEEKIVDLIQANRSTIVFANSRRLAERLTARLNEIHADRLEAAALRAAPEQDAGTGQPPGKTTADQASQSPPAQLMGQSGQAEGAEPLLARAHHGSVSKDQRALIEDDLKSGRLRCVVATSSLELGIDMGAVDLVVQVESPYSVASGLQRVGRAGHQVGEVSQGVLFPKHRGDLVNTAVTVERMLAGKIEPLYIPANPLDILAQQTVAAAALGTIDVEEWFDVVRRSAPFATLPRSAFDATLDLLAGRYPSDEFAELRPRIIWDRVEGTITGRPGAQRLAVTSGGTIPDRGLFGVFLVGSAEPGTGGKQGGRRVGELDEEMVYESRVGDVFALGARLEQRYGMDGSAMASDDGIVLRVPLMDDEPPGADLFLFDAEELDGIVTTEVGGSALFASRFRECAARALLLPRQNPGKRSPLWQQRQRSAQLLDVARKYPTFPIVLETVRECLQDVYDLPALKDIAASIERRELRIVETTTSQPSPFARSMLFGYVASFLYEGDSPLAERRAAALSLDPTLLNELLGRAELRELLDPQVITTTESELQRLAPDRTVRGLEGVADLLRLLGPLTTQEVADRFQAPEESGDAPTPEHVGPLLTQLGQANRALQVFIAGEERWSAVEDAARLRDALGVPLPMGIPLAFIEPVADPLGDLVGRYARTHGPFTAAETAQRLGLGVAVVLTALQRLAADGRVVEGEFRPVASLPEGTAETTGHTAAPSEWCDVEVLRRLRRRSLAALRQEVEPVDPAAYGRFLPSWQHVGSGLRGLDGVATVVDQLSGVPIPASAWEPLILGSRIANYAPAMLDELTATGEVVWSGAGSLPGNDGWIALHLAENAPLTLRPDPVFEPSALQLNLLDLLDRGGAYFFRQLADSLDTTTPRNDTDVVNALWELVWAGRISNDTFTPVRSLLAGGKTAHKQRAAPPRARSSRVGRLGRAPGASLTGSSMRVSGNDDGVRGYQRSTPPMAAGRWTVLPPVEAETTVHAHATAELLLDRYGVVTRGSVGSEGTPGGFGLQYKVLARLEEMGRCRRGYFIEHLGAAQFAVPATVDRLRSFGADAQQERRPGEDPDVVRSSIALAATDPANPYGAALAWPSSDGGHRPGRKAGALVILQDGKLALYVERGGKTVLAFTEDSAALHAAAGALVAVIRRGAAEKMAIEKVNGEPVLDSEVGRALTAAGFYSTPRGLRIRA